MSNKSNNYNVHCSKCGRLKGKLAHTCPPKSWNKGYKHTEKTRRIMVEKRALLRESHSSKVSLAMKGRPRYNRRGENCHLWKGGVTTVNQKIRSSLEYKLWRKAVFERDKYQCVWGGKEHGNKLHVDHIKPFAFYPELRFAIDNGRTLCVDCHKKTESYLNRWSKE